MYGRKWTIFDAAIGLELDILIWIKNGEMKQKLQQYISDKNIRKKISNILIKNIEANYIRFENNQYYINEK
jgi:hypothetical protein